MAGFVHLHLHSEYSLLESSCRIDEIPKYVKSVGQEAVAITDNCALYGVIPFYKACLKEGIKPIIGCEIRYFDSPISKKDPYHLVLLCKNNTGYKNLMKLVSSAQFDSYNSSPVVEFDLLHQYSDGLIALSSGLEGKVSRSIVSGDIIEAEKTITELKDIYHDFYLEILDHGSSEEKSVNNIIVSLSSKLLVPLVACNDVHYLKRSDNISHNVLLKISENNREDINKNHIFDTGEHYLKTETEMNRLFANYEEAINNTVKISEKCNVTFEFGVTKIPVFKCPNNISEDEYLQQITFSFLERKINNGTINFHKHSKEEYIKRINYELSVIKKMGYSGYFLIVWDFVNYAKSADIPVGPGRGSGAGSLVAFVIGITTVDSLEYDLIFERFLNPERVSMPDFDIDFGDTRRNEVIEYVKEKYGYDHTAQIITFGTLAAKAVVRDVGKVLNMSSDVIDNITSLIPREINITLKDALKVDAFYDLYNSSDKLKELIDISIKLEGLPRHISVHAAGVVITENPVSDYVPLTKSGDTIVTQYDMTSVLELGVLKFDFLAIRYLTVIYDAVTEIKKINPNFDIELIPLNDVDTYKLISDGNTDGVFQLESQGIKNVLRNLKPENLDDIIAAIALYRPGPMSSIPKYIDSRHGRIIPKYCTPLLESILDSTYGCIVYQEQVMQIFCSLAGYSLGHSDIVRRAIAKKHADELMREKDSFIAGAVSNGISKSDASNLFSDIEDFADYAFNKSHAAAYAVLSYRTAYLKTHYPSEYYCALMTSVLNYTDKISEYVNVLKHEDIKILPPNVNISEVGFSTHNRSISFGLGTIKNLGVSICQNIVNNRKSEGPFLNFENFMIRGSKIGLNKRQAEALIKSGALDSLGTKRSVMIASFEKFLIKNIQKDESQLDLFASSDFIPKIDFTIEDKPEYSIKEKLKMEFEYLGVYLSGTLFDDYADIISGIKQDDYTMILSQVKQNQSTMFNNAKVCAVIKDIRRKLDKNNNPMAFITLELQDGTLIDTIAFSKVLESFPSIDDVSIVSLNLGYRNGRLSIQIAEILSLKEYGKKPKEYINGQKIYIKTNGISDADLMKLYALIDVAEGKAEIIIYNSITQKASKLVGKGIELNSFTILELKKLFGDDSIIVK